MNQGKVEDQRTEVYQKPSSSLSGERLNQIPNNTNKNAVIPKNNSIQAPKHLPHSQFNISIVLDNIKRINAEQVIRNEQIFGPVDNTTVVIVVQVHNRLHYLKQLIVSLSTSRDIDKTLLIFSHDFWDPQINELVNSIDFAKVLQIFYPYSIQTHPKEFPGESPNDCPRDTTKEHSYFVLIPKNYCNI